LWLDFSKLSTIGKLGDDDEREPFLSPASASSLMHLKILTMAECNCFQIVGRPGARVFELEGVSVRAKFRFTAFVTNGFNADGLLPAEVSRLCPKKEHILQASEYV
jgi:hypothetical protein